MIRYDKPKKKGCGGTCSGCKAGKGCDGKKGMGPAGRKTKSPENDMDRDDALTPQEYLAACDLGIQGQRRAYIRSRLDMAESLREDQKCGKSGIAKGKKCKKPQTAVGLGAKIGGGIGATTGAIDGTALGVMGAKYKGLGAGKQVAWGAAGAGGVAGARGLVGAGLGAGTGLIVRAINQRGKKKRRDSIDPRFDKKCGNSGVAEGKQCRKGSGAVSTIGKVAAGAGLIAGGVAAVKNRSAIGAAVGSGAMKTATAAGSAYGKAQRTVSAVRRGGMTGVAAAAGKNTARVQNAASKVTAGVRQKAAPTMKSVDYQRRNIMRKGSDTVKKVRARRSTRQLSLSL